MSMGILSRLFGSSNPNQQTYTSEQSGRNFEAVGNEFYGDVVKCEGCGCLMRYAILDVHDCRPDNPNVWEDTRDYNLEGEGEK